MEAVINTYRFGWIKRHISIRCFLMAALMVLTIVMGMKGSSQAESVAKKDISSVQAQLGFRIVIPQTIYLKISTSQPQNIESFHQTDSESRSYSNGAISTIARINGVKIIQPNASIALSQEAHESREVSRYILCLP